MNLLIIDDDKDLLKLLTNTFIKLQLHLQNSYNYLVNFIIKSIFIKVINLKIKIKTFSLIKFTQIL